MIRFQSTHPRGVRQAMTFQTTVDKNFNPRTRVGCDHVEAVPTPEIIISIHAPAWGATRKKSHCSRLRQDFNPRTRVGCDDGGEPLGVAFRNFNPRTRVGCDLLTRSFCRFSGDFNPRTRVGCDEEKAPIIRYAFISIHAPAWGATSETLHSCHTTVYFNPRTRVGCDAIRFFKHCAAISFQSTHPRGVRLPKSSANNGS